MQTPTTQSRPAWHTHIGSIIAGLSLAGSVLVFSISRWDEIEKRILVVETQRGVEIKNQLQRDDRQDAESLRRAQQTNSKLDEMNRQLKFITETLVEKGVARRG